MGITDYNIKSLVQKIAFRKSFVDREDYFEDLRFENKCKNKQNGKDSVPTLTDETMQEAKNLLLSGKHEQNLILESELGPKGYAIFEAIIKKDFAVLKELLNSDNVNERFGDVKMTALHLAAAVGTLPVLKQILNITNVDVNCLDNYGNTPLLILVRRVSTTIDTELHQKIKELIKSGVEVTKANNGGAVALHFLAIKGQQLSAKFLLQTPNNSYSAKDLISALNLATFGKHHVICDMILNVIIDHKKKEIAEKLLGWSN